jgi:hypothetical protein
MLHQLDLRQAQLLALREILCGPILKVRLSIGSIDNFMNHVAPPQQAGGIASRSRLLDALSLDVTRIISFMSRQSNHEIGWLFPCDDPLRDTNNRPR